MTSIYGLTGYPLSHSFSPAYFNAKFAREGIDAQYHLFPIEHANEFPSLLKNHPEIKGLNVTIPYKEAIAPYLDELDEVAEEIGAVNCIDIRDKRTKGYNTDVIGFEKSLLPLLQPYHKRALILGTGGASKAVGYVLGKLGIEYEKVSRQKSQSFFTYEDITPDIIKDYALIFNTTPLGMYPKNNFSPPIPYEAISSRHLLYDLIYNPEETKFLQQGKQHGATIKNGLEMLELQAEAAWKIWNNKYHYPTV